VDLSLVEEKLPRGAVEREIAKPVDQDRPPS
jgi:hypothetical protein